MAVTLSEIIDGIKDLIKPYSNNPNELTSTTFDFSTDEYMGYEKSGIMYKIKSITLVNKLLTTLRGNDWTDETLASNKLLITKHIDDDENPHSVTKAQVGLGNADNTSDADKPVSTAMQSALDSKANSTQEDLFYPTPLNGAVSTTGDMMRYYKDTTGAVHLTGGVSNSDGTLPCFNVVEGYRADRDITFNLVSSSNNTIFYGTLDTDGDLYITVPDDDVAHVNLVFRAGE